MVTTVKRVVESTVFQRFITAVILFAGVLVGAETYPALHERYRSAMHALDLVVLGIFTLEIVLKLVAEGSKPWRFFRDPWNVFDFVVVAASFMPVGAGSEAIVVLRLVRLLRVLRLVRALPRLQLLVAALLKSIPSMAYVSVLLFLLFYVYGVAAVFLFGKNDPVHFGNLQISILSLFRTVTLEGWTALMYTQMYGCASYGYEGNQALCTQSSASPLVGAAFFVSFVLLGTMIVLNLFIGVIMNGMSEAHAEAEEERKENDKRTRGAADPHLDEELEELATQLAGLQKSLAAAQRRARKSRTSMVKGVDAARAQDDPPSLAAPAE